MPKLDPNAAAVLDQFFAALKRNDVEGMKACFNQRSLSGEAGQFSPPQDAGNFSYVVEDAVEESADKWCATVAVTGEGAPPKLPMILVKEEGAWKIDMAESIDRLMGPMMEQMQSAMSQVGEAMGQAMGAVGEAMGQAMSGLSGGTPPVDGEQAIDDAEASRQRALLDEALPGMRDTVQEWQQMMRNASDSAVELEVDFDSLEGRQDRLMGLIHGAGAAVEAWGHLGWMSRCRPYMQNVTRVKVTRATNGYSGMMTQGDEITFEVRAVAGSHTLTPGEAVDLLTSSLGIPAEGEASADPELQAMAAGREDESPAQSAPTNDVDYAQAAKIAARIEHELRAMGAWTAEPPSDEALNSGTPFGQGAMAFEQWIQWVLLERINSIIAERGEFPARSNLAAYGVRNWDPVEREAGLLDALQELDAFIEGR